MSDSVIDYEAWRVEKAGAHAFVQWKGTNVCMDLYCPCGAQGHIDADFAYTVRCEDCKTVYETEPFVRLLKASPEGARDAEMHDAIYDFGDDTPNPEWIGWPEVLAYLDASYERDKDTMDAEKRELLWRFLRRHGASSLIITKPIR